MLNQKTIITIGVIILLAIGFSFAGGKSDKEALNKEQTTIQEIDTTKLERYERKVIIKAKVGKGHGEMGLIGGPDEIGPTGLAVDSVGNVYVLDGVNHRIQKYSNKFRLISVINLVVPSGSQLYEYDVNNQLAIGQNGDFYIIGFGSNYFKSGRSKFEYNRFGNLIGQNITVSEPGLNTRVLTVKNLNVLPDLYKMEKDTVLLFHCENSKGETYIVRLPLEKKEGWQFSYATCLGWDRYDNVYFRIVLREDIPAWPPRDCMERTLARNEEQIVFKFNDEGQMMAIIKEKTPGIGFEFWTIGGDGAIYLLKYSFKLVVTDELPEWVKNDSNMTEEQKKAWRREYMAPEGYVYVIKFTKVEEK